MMKAYKIAVLAAALNGAAALQAGYEDVGMGSRPLGMGGAFVALADDANALYWNPAGLTQVKRQEALFMHGLYGGLSNINFNYLAYVHPMESSAIGVGWSQTGVTLEEGDGSSARTSRLNEDIYYLAMGLKTGLLGNDFTVGATLKRLTMESSLDNGSGMGFDLGAMYKAASWIQAGFMMRNVAADIRSENLRSTMRLGLASLTFNNRLRLAFDANMKDNIGETDGAQFKMHAGLEVAPWDVIAARVGFDDGQLTYGLGFNFASVKIDYGFKNSELVGNLHRVSLGYEFGSNSAPRAEKAAPKAVKAAPKAAPQALVVTKDASGEVSTYRLGASLAFEKNSSNLSDSGVETLQTLVNDLEKNPKQLIEIYGYSDSTGSTALNREVTLSRARSVEKALVKLGLGPGRIAKVRGMGEADPIADNETEEGQAQNRRVEFKVVK